MKSRLLPNIRYGTERYPEKVARRLRALNITTWIAAVVASGFAIVQFLDPTPGLWKSPPSTRLLRWFVRRCRCSTASIH